LNQLRLIVSGELKENIIIDTKKKYLLITVPEAVNEMRRFCIAGGDWWSRSTWSGTTLGQM